MGSDLEKAIDKTWDSYWMRTGEKKKSGED
jgi:hypothetical protein